MAQSFRKGNRCGEHIRKQEVMPSSSMDAMLGILRKDKNKRFFRENLADRLIWLDPYLAQFFFVKKVPFGMMADSELLATIEPDMSLKKKRDILNKSLTDVSGLRACELNKITGLKRRINREGKTWVSSNTEEGYSELKSTSLESVAKKIYNILNWNKGQLEDWHSHFKRFKDECKDKTLIETLRNHTTHAYDRSGLTKLTDDMAIHAGVVPM